MGQVTKDCAITGSPCLPNVVRIHVDRHVGMAYVPEGTAQRAARKADDHVITVRLVGIDSRRVGAQTPVEPWNACGTACEVGTERNRQRRQQHRENDGDH